jgi:SOS regulatory protein LexA
MSITKKQKEVYDYISSYAQEYGYAPTQKEIKEHFEFKSFGSVQRYIKYLTEAGYLEADWNARRGLKAVKPESAQPAEDTLSIDLPLLGEVAAGIPIEAIENPEQTITVPKYMIKTPGQRHFALKVKGDSMIEDGIFEGDVIVCRHQQTAHQGQTVVAVIEGEATVKRMYKKKGLIELHPANATMEPFYIDQNSGDFKLAGVLIGLLRSYE